MSVAHTGQFEEYKQIGSIATVKGSYPRIATTVLRVEGQEIVFTNGRIAKFSKKIVVVLVWPLTLQGKKVQI